jgi:hypothetical protein
LFKREESKKMQRNKPMKKFSFEQGIAMPRLFGNPSPNEKTKYLEKAKHYFASKTQIHAWERTVVTPALDANGNPQLDANGNAVINETVLVESMLNIFPDGHKPGRYPVPITVRRYRGRPTDTDAVQKTKMKEWEKEYDNMMKQKQNIIDAKLIYSAEFKESFDRNVTAIMRRSAEGRSALDNNDPLEIINCLIATDFSPQATVEANPSLRYEEADVRFNEIRQGFDEPLDAFEKRYGAERVNLENLAAAAGKSGMVPDEETMALKFFMRTNGLYNKVREDIRTGTRTGGYPKTIDDAMIILRPFEKISKSNNQSKAPIKGVFINTKNNEEKNKNKIGASGAVNTKGWLYRCPAHKSNNHDYNDEVCQEIIRCVNSNRAERKKGNGGKSASINITSTNNAADIGAAEGKH